MRWLKLFAVLLVFSAAGCSTPGGEEIDLPLTTGTAKVGPAEQTVYFAISDSGRARVDLTVPRPAQISTPVDVVLLLDRTASMEKYIRNAAKASNSLVAQVRGLAPDSRFAVATLADYYPTHTPGEPDSVPWKLEQDFTNEAGALERALGAVRITNGGDIDEAYTTALYESAGLKWRDKARRFIVLVGDSFNHSLDPGPDGVEGTADDLRLEDALKALRAQGVTVLGIQAGSDPMSTAMFRTLAAQTDGSLASLDSASDTARLLQASILSALLPKVDIKAQGPYAGWVRDIVPDEANHNGHQEFMVNIAVPPSTSAGLYVLPVRLTLREGGQSVHADANVRLVVGWINHPLTPFLPLLLLLAIGIAMVLRTVGGRFNSSYQVIGSGPFWEDTPKWIMVVLETLIWLSIILAIIGVIFLLNKNWIPSEIIHRIAARF